MVSNLNSKIVIPEKEFMRFLKRTGWTWQQAARGAVPAPFVDLEEYQLACIASDPYLWATFNLLEPEDPVPPEEKKPFQFWPYQVTSLRWPGSLVHYCAAEVGKSRELLVKALYLIFNTPYGSGLIGAPEIKFLRPILEGMEEQFEWNPDLGNQVKSRQKDGNFTTKIVFKNGFKLHFQQSGPDGKPYRRIHVSTFAFKDEAAKDHHPGTWSEFYSRMRPGCILGLYSVPDGNRLEFWRMAQIAKETTKSKALKDFLPTDMRFFNWPKSLMPDPFWNEARRRYFIDLYKGETHPDYLHNVLGLDGDPDASVFPYELLKTCIKDIPEYRCLTITATNTGFSLSGYDLDGSEPRYLIDEQISTKDFNPKKVVKNFFSRTPGHLTYFMGADLAFKPDPSEFYVKADIDGVHRLIARVKLQGCEYPEQGRVWDALDDVFSSEGNQTRSGIDAGNAGTAFYQYTVETFPDKHFEERMFPVSMASKHDELDKDGNPIIDKFTEKPIRRRAKTLGTNIIIDLLLKQETEYPRDPDIVKYYPSYTAKKGPDGDSIFSEQNEHHIAADQAGTFAYCRLVDPPIDLDNITTSGIKLSTFAENTQGVFNT